jgi:hypothetical protein
MNGRCADSIFRGVGQRVYDAIQALPYLDIVTDVQPLTATVIRLTLTITPQFKWIDSVCARTHRNMLCTSMCNVGARSWNGTLLCMGVR